MIDQRVSEGILSNFFNEKALTTTIPAQLVKNSTSKLFPSILKESKILILELRLVSPIILKRNIY